LCFLCPNCHALTSTYKGKNIKTYKAVEAKDPKKCIDCYCEISKEAERCEKCNKTAQRKVERPSYEQLLEDLSKMCMVKVGEKYSVSDNCIRKWIIHYEKNM
jgi:hypothetical protein